MNLHRKYILFKQNKFTQVFFFFHHRNITKKKKKNEYCSSENSYCVTRSANTGPDDACTFASIFIFTIHKSASKFFLDSNTRLEKFLLTEEISHR